MAPIIVTRGLRKEYKTKSGTVVAVEGIDLDVEAGEVFGLLGPNGAGKTTTIQMLATIVRPSAGSASVAGHDIRTAPARVRQACGIVFQEPTLDSILTARENLQLHARLYGVPPRVFEERIEELLGVVELSARADDLVKTFSGGMKRRLEIARGILHHPKVLFLDEPTLGLDPQSRQRVWEYIRAMREREGTTIILTTHYMEEADALCDRIGIIDRGRVAALDAPRRLKAALGGDIVRLSMGGRVEGFETLPFVKKVEWQDGTALLTVERASEHLAEILAHARGVKSVEVRVPTLEDVFLTHTGRDLREETPDDAEAAAMASLTNQGR
ncbi:MAG TPA: ATP-binding cassette domain-containing protein [Candidatus Thermoplasmatota archaeon]|nr:ATP-binding cassette domain-containing protein [Candidatus Thermoplasmatota archaeon]